MITIKEAIIVEGRYDINIIKQLVDTIVIETGGFGIFNNAERLRMIRRIAAVRGILVLTDSDGAGFVIRNYLNGTIPKEQIKHAYIPDIYGKERRKRQGGKEGKLGVEGMKPSVLIQALRRAGATIIDDDATSDSCELLHKITKADFYEFGLSGRSDSALRRAEVLKQLDLPEHMTANALLEFINAVADIECVQKICMNYEKGD